MEELYLSNNTDVLADRLPLGQTRKRDTGLAVEVLWGDAQARSPAYLDVVRIHRGRREVWRWPTAPCEPAEELAFL